MRVGGSRTKVWADLKLGDWGGSAVSETYKEEELGSLLSKELPADLLRSDIWISFDAEEEEGGCDEDERALGDYDGGKVEDGGAVDNDGYKTV